MREKSAIPKATKTSADFSKSQSNVRSQPNSAVRSSNLESYHHIAASVFNINDTAELEAMFLAGARDGDFCQTEALLRRRNDLAFNLDIRDTETGNTALIWAAKRGYYKIVELLLRHGADVTLRNFEGQTAIEVGSPTIRNLLLDSVTYGGPHRNLLQAAWQGDAALVQKILSEHRVDINCCNSDGLTPLLLVTRDIQLFDKISDKLTKSYNPTEVVTELLQHRADPNVADEDGRSPLHYASSSRAPQCAKLVEILLQEGADIEKRDRRCFTPIHCAAQSGNVDVVLVLLNNGSEANSRGFAGTTPLHISAINGNVQVVSTLLFHGADVRLVDDGGLTCVDVAKTKKVKAALKEAWAEVTKTTDQRQVSASGAEGLRRSSQSNSIMEITQNHNKKTGGEVIFDLREAWTSSNRNSLLDFDVKGGLLPPVHLKNRTHDKSEEALPGPTAESITPRRASTIVSIERHLSHAESVKRSKDKQYKDLAPASRGNRRRTPTSCARSPTAGRRLTPLKSVKGGPSIRPQNGPVQLHMGFRKSTSDLTKSEAVVPPVTNLGLELADNLHENRGNRLPTSRVISSKTTQQAHRSDQYAITNIADVSNLVDEFYLRGRSSSKASTFTLSDDYDDQVPPPMPISPQRLTPIRTPSASEKNRGLRIPNTINEGEMGGASEYVVNPGRQGDYNTHFSNGNLASVQSKNTMYVFPNQPKVLACSPICSPPEGADIKLVDCSQDFINKTDSPRSASNLGKEGSFNIKETRIRGSDDSGIPEDKNSSKSSSVSSSVSNLSSSSAGLPDLDDRETSGDHGSSTSQQGKDSKEAVNIKKSESDSILGRSAPEGKGTCKNVDSVKLKQIAKDNAKITQQKSVLKDNDTSRSTALRKGVTTGSKQEAVGKNSSKLVVPASAKTNAKVSSGTQETNQNTNRGMESVQVHKSFQQGTKSSASPNVNLQETTKANNQPRSRPWNSSTNLKSINTRLGSTSNNTNKPPVPARPSAQAVSRQGMAPAKGQLAAVSQTPKVIVEELEQEEVSPDQDKPEGTSSEASDPIQGPANRMNTVSDSNATKLKPINSGVAGPGTMENNSSKSNHASNSMTRGITDDRTTAKLKPSNTAVNKQANSVPAATSGRQNNVSRVQAKPGTAPKPSQTRQTSKPNVPKNSVANPERPPRKSQSTSSVSVDDGHLAKQPHTTQRCDRKDEDKGSAVISDNQTDEPGAASEGSKPSTEPETTSSSSTAVKVCKGGMTVEEVDVPLPLTGVNEGKEKSSATGQNSTKTTGHSVAQSNSELLKSSGSDESTSSSGLPPVVNTNIVPNEKSSAPSIKQIQVKPYQEETAPSQHEGPVIVDIFESLRRERELAEQQQREEAATKQKQLSHPKKVKTPDARVMSASSRTKRSIKSATSEKNAERSKRQQAKKTKKRSKKKSEKEELMLSERMEKKQKRVNNSRKLSGEDWYRHSEDGNNKGSGDRQENDELDDSDDETTWVQPNYIGKDSDYDEDDDILTTSIQRNDESLRRSWERKTKCIPGQIHGDDSDDDLPEDVFEDTEDVQLNVVFTIGSLSDESPGTTTRDIIDITHETNASESLFKPSGKVNLRRVDVKGTSDTVKQPGGILPQVSEAIAAFSRQVTGIELDEMLEGEAYRDSPAHLESDQVKDTASCDSCAKASDSQYKDSGGQSDVGHLDKNHNNKTDNTGFTDVQKEKNNKGSDVLKTETLVQNTVIRHSEGFKAPKVKPVKVERNQSEDEEIREMINEILKSTPDPSLTLSWKSRSERSCTSEGSRTSVQRSSLQRSLADSQNCSFKEIPNVADKESSSFHPLPTEDEENEIKTLQKLVDTCKNMPLQVDIIQGQGQALNNEAVPKGKPPVPPKSLTSGKPAVMQSMKSPRFVRKHDSVKGRQHKVTLLGDTDTSETGSDFDTVSLPMDDQDTLVPSDRAETVTSHLGRHNSGSRATSSMTNRSDDVETIQWKRGNLLGKGAFGKVWCGLTNAGELIAVKQIELNIDNMEKAEREYEKIQEEVELLKTLKHQNIVGYLGTSLEDNVVSIFMQFVPGGSIFNLISRFGALEEEVFCRYTQQILQGVEYLHSNNVIHRDIKGGNIMLMQNGVIKLIDFGCAKRLYLNVTPSLNSRNKEQLLKSMRGTPYWMAPEVVREEGHGTKSDIWSIGCTVFEMATMKPPWANEPPYAAIFAIGNNDKPVPSLPQKFSQEARLFVSACLTRDQNKRPSATQLLSHAFILKRKKKPGSFS